MLALRHPDQDGPPPEGVELYELPLSPPSRGRAWALRGAALALREPVEARRLSAPFLEFLPRPGTFDVAHVMLGTLAPIAPALDMPALIAPLDAWHRNVEAEAASASGLERAWRLAQAAAVRRFEGRAYRPFARVVLVTDEDAAEVRALDPSLRTETIPNGVDAAHFAPPAPSPSRAGVLFTGALDAPANEQAAVRLAERIMPLVRRSIPDAALSLVGRSPGDRVRALDATVVADVPDLRPYLWGCAAYACPMVSGTGIKNKLLEAMAAGAPCVATPLACQGIAVRDEVRVADSDEAFAAALVDVLRSPGGLGEAGREYVTAHHDWDAVVDAYSAVYERIAA
nr:glycosyltransferase [Solirubrobacter soli]